MSSERFLEFASAFDHHCRTVLTPEQKRKELVIDAEVLLGQLTLPVVQAIDQIEPFGLGNPRPLLMAGPVRVVGDPRPCGNKQQHLRLRLAQESMSVAAVGWNIASRAKDLVAGASCAVVFSPQINEWNGRREVQLEIRDFRLDRTDAQARSA